jgi:3',5'-cyclic-AMP phosphodiesterase
VNPADVPLRIVQLSDIHCGTPTFQPGLMQRMLDTIAALRPDVVVVAGDLTAAGYSEEFAEAAAWLGRLDVPTVVVPGNHDARNLGHVHFLEHFGECRRRLRIPLEGERAERVRATGITIVAVDSSRTDVNEGEVGAATRAWIAEQFPDPDDVKALVLHHHLVSIPGTGRERNTIVDAGEVLELLTELDVDLVLSGHKHVPWFWAVNGLLICNSSTATTRRVRGRTPPSWSELRVDATTVKVFLHYEDGRRSLSVIRSRNSRRLVREASYVTPAFRTWNPLPVAGGGAP